MKPFNLEKAKAGKPVCTKIGEPVRIICFDADGDQPIIGLFNDGTGNEVPHSWNIDGEFARGSDGDLMMEEEYININGHGVSKPMTDKLKIGKEYFIASLSSSNLYQCFKWTNETMDNRWLKRNIIHLTKEAARKHADALLSCMREK